MEASDAWCPQEVCLGTSSSISLDVRDDIDYEIGRTLSKLAYNTKLSSTVDTTERRGDIQRDLVKMER